MKKLISIIPIILFCGCAEVQKCATAVITDPNVIAAAKNVGDVALGVAAASNADIAAAIAAILALVTAGSALYKASKKTEQK